MSWVLFQFGTLGAILLLFGAFLYCVLSGIAERIEKQKKERAERAYRHAWRDWGDKTNLRAL